MGASERLAEVMHKLTVVGLMGTSLAGLTYVSLGSYEIVLKARRHKAMKAAEAEAAATAAADQGGQSS